MPDRLGWQKTSKTRAEQIVLALIIAKQKVVLNSRYQVFSFLVTRFYLVTKCNEALPQVCANTEGRA